MSIYLVLPLLACVASAVLATAVCCRVPSARSSRNATLLLGGVSFWAACELLWNASGDPHAALAYVKASALGWTFIGPLGIGLALSAVEPPSQRVRRAQPALIAAGFLFLLIDWFTPWFHTGVVRTSWGWGYELGPAFALFQLYVLGCLGVVLSIGAQIQRSLHEERHRIRARRVTWWLIGCLGIAGWTDGVLPIFGVQVLHLGTIVHASFGCALAWTLHRSRHPLLAPGLFAREILETLPEGVALLRLDGRIRYGNSAMAKLLSRPASELDGLDVRDLMRGLSERAIGELTDAECEIVTDDGDSVPISLSSARLSDLQGSPIAVVLVARDLRELEALRGRLLISGRLAAVGELAAGIAHEINNPLAYVRANLSLLRTHWESLGVELEKSGDSGACDELIAEGAEMIDESLEGVDRASAIVRDVKGLAHAGRGERRLADVNELLDGVLRMAAPQLRVTATVKKEYGLLPLVTCAPQELQQVFLNLVLNASQAIANRGTIRVRTEAQKGSVMIWIEDDGCGIEPDLLSRIFDPFFTTKPVGEGTGLGLGIAHEIVRKHGGEIAVDSRCGRGSSFCVRLPVRADTLDPS